MRRIIVFIAIVVTVVIAFKFCDFKNKDATTLEYNTALIQQQILNVGKLVVTEGHFSEVLTYRDKKGYLLDLLTSEKKAIIIVNADVTVAYDLREVKYDIDETTKTITIVSIPKEEIKISPDIQYYNIEHGGLNQFTGDDYNKVNKIVRSNLAKKVDKSSLKTNAKNRLVSELSKILILTNSLGWTLRYNGEEIQQEQDFNKNL